jgi:twitching motility protein PilT
MATPTAQAPPTAAAAAPARAAVATAAIVSAMVNSGKGISDLIFSPGRPPQVEVSGHLTAVNIEGVGVMKPEDTARVAGDLIGPNKLAIQQLKEDGSADLSYSVPGLARFRVNIFRQRSTYAIVMRVIPNRIPSFEELGIPPVLKECAELKNGVVLVTGPTGSGKSSTLAAIIDLINDTKPEHIITIEDPIEFLHRHKKATIHQRELHNDTPTFSLALRAALRQAPKVILVGEMRDKETIEIALTAAETGHLVFSTLHTIDASKTVERIIGVFPMADQKAIRGRLAGTFRFFVSQRLLPKRTGGRIAAIEILKSTMRTRDYVEKGEGEGKTLLDAMKEGGIEGMQDFDTVIEQFARDRIIDMETALLYATNSGNLRLSLSDFDPDEADDAKPATRKR